MQPDRRRDSCTALRLLRCLKPSPSARELDERTTDTSTIHLLRRHRSPLRQQGHALPQAGSGRFRHPLPARGPRRPRGAGHASSTSAASTRHRAGARRGQGRHGRAPARGARQPRHRQRRRRAELAGSADHGRQRGAVRLPDSRGGREAAAAARGATSRCCGRCRCRTATSASRSIRRITSRSPTASPSIIRCCGTSRARSASPRSRSSTTSRRRARSAS